MSEYLGKEDISRVLLERKGANESCLSRAREKELHETEYYFQNLVFEDEQITSLIEGLSSASFPNSTENKGEWIFINHHWECSRCGGNPNYGTGFTPGAEMMKERYKFCNLCGADMRGVKAE